MVLVYTKKYKSAETTSQTSIADTASKSLAQNKVENSATSQTTDSVQTQKESTTVSAPKSKTKFVYYTVQRGDTLWNIANRKGVSVEEIKRLNNIRSSNSLKAGSKIKIAVAS